MAEMSANAKTLAAFKKLTSSGDAEALQLVNALKAGTLEGVQVCWRVVCAAASVASVSESC